MENLPVEDTQGTRGPLKTFGRCEILRQEFQGTWKFVRVYSKIMIWNWLFSSVNGSNGHAKTLAFPAIRFPYAFLITTYLAFVLGRVDAETGKVAKDIFRILFNFMMGYGMFGFLFWIGYFPIEGFSSYLENSNLKLTRTMGRHFESRPEPEEHGYIMALFMIYYLNFALIFLMRGVQLGSSYFVGTEDELKKVKVEMWSSIIVIVPTSIAVFILGRVLWYSLGHP